METSVLNQYNQTKRLISILQDFMGNLEKRIVVYPKQELEDAVYRGFPVNIYNTYYGGHLWRNETDVRCIISYIKEICIPYLENIAGKLYEILNETGNATPYSLSASDFGLYDMRSGNSHTFQEMKGLSTQDRIAMIKNCRDFELFMGAPWGQQMSIEEADKQNANPNYNKSYQYKVNCATCAAAYVLRLRGFNIQAKGNPRKKDNLNTWLSKCNSFEIWNNLDGSKATPVYICDWMKKNGLKKMYPQDYRMFFDQVCAEKGVYIFTLKWKYGGGHATILQRDYDGRLYHIEPQVYNPDKGEDGRRSLEELVHSLARVQPKEKGIMRVDNKLFNMKYVSLFCKKS